MPEFEMPELEELVKIEITTPLPEEWYLESTFRIEGSVKMFDAIGAPPWVYAEVKKKDWYKPEVIEEVTYERGFPVPISGDFNIDWKPRKLGTYEVTIVATPAPLPLPLIGVPPIIGRSDMMKTAISEKPPGEYAGLKIISYEKITA